MVNPIGPQPPVHFSQYDVETYTYQQRWANPNPHVIESGLPSPFELAKAQESNASRKKKRSKENKKNQNSKKNLT